MVQVVVVGRVQVVQVVVVGRVQVVQGLVVAGRFWCSYAWVSLTLTAPMHPV